MTPDKIKFLKGWLQGRDGRDLVETSPAKYYYLSHMLDGDPENPLVEADEEYLIFGCKCEKKGGPYVGVYLAPREFLSVCQKCGGGGLFQAEHDPRQWKVTWNDPKTCKCGSPSEGKRIGRGVCGLCHKTKVLFRNPQGAFARCRHCLKSQKTNSMKKD